MGESDHQAQGLSALADGGLSSFLAFVQPSSLRMREPERWRHFLAPLVGKWVRLSVRPPNESKQDLYGYYYSTVLPEFAEAYGEACIATMHTELKTWFAARVNPDTLELEVPSLADLTVSEMAEFVDKVLRRAALNGWYISPPRSKA